MMCSSFKDKKVFQFFIHLSKRWSQTYYHLYKNTALAPPFGKVDELKIYKLNAGKVYFQGKCCLEFIFIFLGA